MPRNVGRAAYDALVRRTFVYSTAGVLLAIAVLLTIFGWADDTAKLPDWQALALGFVQGFTELLPVSSSGHLILTPWLFDWTYLQDHPSFNKTFDVALHLGTLVAVVAYFWRDLVRYLVAWLHSLRRRSVIGADEKIAWLIVVASIPAAIIGAAFESVIEDHLGEPWQIAILLAVFAGVLWWADQRPERKDIRDLCMRQGLLLGLAQSLALAPGVSRSGVTITRRAVPRAHTGRSRTALVPPARADRTRRRAPQGPQGRRLRRSPGGVGGAVRRGHADGGRQRAARDLVAARVPAPP